MARVCPGSYASYYQHHPSVIRQAKKIAKTYHKIHRPRPRARRPIRLHIHIRLRLINHRRIPRKSSSVTRCTAHVPQCKNDLEDLRDGLLCVCHAGTTVEACAIEVVCGSGAGRIDRRRIGEVVWLGYENKIGVWLECLGLEGEQRERTFTWALLKLAHMRSPAFILMDGRPFPCGISASTAAFLQRPVY